VFRRFCKDLARFGSIWGKTRQHRG